MDITLVICESLSDPLSVLALEILGPSAPVSAVDFCGNFDGHSTVALVYCSPAHRGMFGARCFMEKYSFPLKERRVALICAAEEPEKEAEALSAIVRSLGFEPCRIISAVFPGYLPENAAGKLMELRRRLKDSRDMPEDMLRKSIDEILSAHNTCTLCTGSGGYVRATPIEYLHADGQLYFISEGGEKFSALAVNSAVSVAVYNPYEGFGKLESLQIEGRAETVAPFSGEYNEIMEKRGLSPEKVKALPARMNMIRVLPRRFEVLKSEFAKRGYSPKQVLET